VGGATRAFYLEVLGEGLGIIGDSGANHLVIGGIAEHIHFGRPLNPSEDIDVLVRSDDAERLLERFEKHGYTTYRRDESWIYKAARPDVTIDRSSEPARRSSSTTSTSRARTWPNATGSRSGSPRRKTSP
jgi:hypothetical protein